MTRYQAASDARARKDHARAVAEPRTENLHEWRKRVKYHRYHLRLLKGLWAPVMRPLWESAKLLGDRLGDDHDLAVLRQTLVDEPELSDARERELALALIDQRRKELQAWSLPLGQRLFAQKPKRFRRGVRRLWDAREVERQLDSVLPSGSERVS